MVRKFVKNSVDAYIKWKFQTMVIAVQTPLRYITHFITIRVGMVDINIASLLLHLMIVRLT